MGIDAFLAGGFEAPGSDTVVPPKKKRKAKEAGDKPKKVRTRKPKKSAPAADKDDSSDDDMGELTGAVASHKNQLKALKDADPEFYKYLAESDKGLLTFESDEEASDAEKEEAVEPSAMDVGDDDDDDDDAAQDTEMDGPVAGAMSTQKSYRNTLRAQVANHRETSC